MTALNEWESFYVIVGSGAAALIGLQFVVMTLLAERPSVGSAEASAAFGTPTVVHFSTVLFLSAVLSAPWHGAAIVAGLLALIGFGGVVYGIIVIRRVRQQSAYQPEFEDWLFHALLPLIAYLVLALSALAATTHAHAALFGVAVAVLLLLFVGIHNAWDAVSYHVLVNLRKD